MGRGLILSLTIAGLLFLSALAGARAEGPRTIDFVIDLDWTLLYQITDPRQVTDRSRLIRDGKTLYRLADDAEAFIHYLSQIPGARVSFFSGGSRERNEAVLRQIRLPDGRTAAEFKIFGFEDLTAMPVPGDPNAKRPFAERFKKNLKSVLPDIDLDRATLIDDTIQFAFPGQERNLLSLDPTFDFVENYSTLAQHRQERPWSKLKYLPSTRTGWALERRKLQRATGLIREALDLSERDGVPFATALRSLQLDEQGVRRYPFDLGERRFFDSGQRLLGDSGALQSYPCERTYREVLRQAGQR